MGAEAPLAHGAGGQVALQQLPVPVIPVRQWEVSDLVEQCVTTCGHGTVAEHAVTPSSQRPSVHVPGSHVTQVTKPFLPQVERAAQRTALPLQFTSSSPLLTASRTLPTTQRTYCPWFLSQVHSLRTRSRTVFRSGSLQPAEAVEWDRPRT